MTGIILPYSGIVDSDQSTQCGKRRRDRKRATIIVGDGEDGDKVDEAIRVVDNKCTWCTHAGAIVSNCGQQSPRHSLTRSLLGVD
jgi:hypothetical protein